MEGRAAPMLLGLLALALLPLADEAAAGHCGTRIYVYGRASIAPGVVTPVEPASPECFPREEHVADAAHTLPPSTEEILVRVHTDIGESYPRAQASLDGLGWRGQLFALDRVEGAASTYYTVPDWLVAPDADDLREPLRVTVRFPTGGSVTTQYTHSPVTRAVQDGTTLSHP